MNKRTATLPCWISTGVFSAATAADGMAGILQVQVQVQVQAGKESLQHLGYPLYLLPIIGTAKLCAVAALLQTRYRTIKEWAYAGLVITCVGAFASRLLSGDTGPLLALPLVFLAIPFVPYCSWKKLQAIRLAP
jgi:hypothetical protein